MAAFEYQRIDTPVHRLNALTKFSILAAVALLISFILDPKYKLPLLILVVIYAFLAKLPWKDYKGLLILVAGSLLLANFIGSLFIVTPSLFKVYSQQWAGTTIFQITPASFPIFGRTAITYGGLLWLLQWPLTGLAVVILVATHIYSTSLNESVQALYSLKAPFPVVYITMVALRFTPELMAQFTLIHRAQVLRGWRVNTRNPVKILRLYAPLLIPVARHVVKSIDITTMATQNRAFGIGKVTNMAEGSMSATDKAILIAVWLIFFVMMILILRYNVGNL